MLNNKIIVCDGRRVGYNIFGSGRISLVIEMGLGAVVGEWWHVAQMLSAKGAVLLYERAGYGCSEKTATDRTPENIADAGTFPNIPLILITHTSGPAVKETMDFGNASRELAEKVEGIWQELMRRYLEYSADSQYIQAQNSTHYIHLTEPEIIMRAVDTLIAQSVQAKEDIMQKNHTKNE